MNSSLTPPKQQYAGVLGFGQYRPSRVVTNDDLSKVVDTSDEWITARVGIKQRRYADDDETIVAMSVAAGADAVKAAGLSAADIDLVIVSSCSLETPLPGAAPEVAYQLGAHAPGAYDLNAACAGFCYSLAAADQAIRTGASERALVIGVEKLSQWVDHTDRSTSIIFADGAGAAVLAATPEQRISPVVWGSAGDKPEAIIARHRDTKLEMDGRAVFRWATTDIRDQLARICDAAGISLRDVDVFVPHQANTRIIDAMLRGQDFRDDVVVARDIEYAGNTSSASVPLAVCALADTGQISSGDKVLTIGFGAGLPYAGQIFVMP